MSTFNPALSYILLNLSGLLSVWCVASTDLGNLPQKASMHAGFHGFKEN